MFKKFFAFALFIALSTVITACGAAANSSPNVSIERAYARAGMPNGAVYMELNNSGSGADAVLSAESDVADAVELHESKMEGDVMKMSPIEKIEVPAGGVATLKPGGMHVMLIGLKGNLAVGDTFKLTLNFENSGAKTIDVEVKEAMQMPANMEMDHGGDMQGEMEGEMKSN